VLGRRTKFTGEQEVVIFEKMALVVSEREFDSYRQTLFYHNDNDIWNVRRMPQFLEANDIKTSSEIV